MSFFSIQARSLPIKPDFAILDGLRGIAAVYVVLNHCRGNLLMGGSEYAKIVPVESWGLFTKLYYMALQFTAVGTEFVIFFFVLSGFSIAHSLTKAPGIGGFFLRRAIRLYPPYVLALVFAGIAFYLVSTLAPLQMSPKGELPVYANSTYIISNLFYIPKGAYIAQFWSLTHEVIFYILIALLFARFLRLYFILSILGYLIGIGIEWKTMAGTSIIDRFVFDYNIFFAVGIGLYLYYDKVMKMLTFRKPFFWTIVVIIFTMMVAVKYRIAEDNRFTLFLSAILSVIMIVNFLHYKIDNYVLRFFGSMSYTIYITHFAAIHLFTIILDQLGFPNHLGITSPYIWITGVIFCLLVAIPFYYAAEYPTKELLKRMRGNKPGNKSIQTRISKKCVESPVR